MRRLHSMFYERCGDQRALQAATSQHTVSRGDQRALQAATSQRTVRTVGNARVPAPKLGCVTVQTKVPHQLSIMAARKQQHLSVKNIRAI
jgi:hypothetical protein